MHFLTNKNNQIIKFHIEKWDYLALGDELSQLIESFIGKNRNDFILFALQNKLFLKIRMLFSMSEEYIYYWGCAPIYEHDREPLQQLVSMGMDIKKLKYAKFYLQSTEDEEFVSVFYETGLSLILTNGGYGAEDITCTLPTKSIKNISYEFNISRNNDNCLYIFLGKKNGVDQLMRASEDELAFIAIDNKSTELLIISEKDAENMTSNEAAVKYIRMIATRPSNNEKKEKAMEILLRLQTTNKKW